MTLKMSSAQDIERSGTKNSPSQDSFHWTIMTKFRQGNSHHVHITNCSFSGNKRISFEEFLPIFLSIGQKKPINSSNEGFVDGLRVFDREGNGQISAAELRHVLTGLGKLEF